MCHVFILVNVGQKLCLHNLGGGNIARLEKNHNSKKLFCGFGLLHNTETDVYLTTFAGLCTVSDEKKDSADTN